MEMHHKHHERLGKIILHIHDKSLADDGGVVRIQDDLMNFLMSVISWRRQNDVEETARVFREMHEDRGSVRLRGPSRSDDFVDRAVLFPPVGCLRDHRQIWVEPTVDLTAKCENAAGEADHHEDGARDETEVEMQIQPDVPHPHTTIVFCMNSGDRRFEFGRVGFCVLISHVEAAFRTFKRHVFLPRRGGGAAARSKAPDRGGIKTRP